ncbi:hypothetical protein AZH46_00275 [Corynebacterium striatum]|nr:hypothetical protein AZH46_00275 [Corynebacterium striatum]
MEWLLGIIATLSVPVVGGVFAWISQKAANKSQRETALIEQSGPDWKAFTDEMKDWTNKQLQERDASIKELREEVASLAQKIGGVEKPLLYRGSPYPPVAAEAP